MDKIYKMKLHETLTPATPDFDAQIIRVPGGWIYRFFDEIAGGYNSNSIFVKFNDGS